jgi:hypothetical protein
MDYLNATRASTMVLEDTVREVEDWVVRENRSLDPNGRYLVKGVEAQNVNTGETVAYDERVRLYTRSDMVTMLESVGVIVSGVFGDYDRSDFIESDSERLILLCEKR